MKLSCKVNLNCSKEQFGHIETTLAACNNAANVVSLFAFNNHTFSQFTLHKYLYKSLRTQFDLSAQTAVRVIGKVADSYKRNKQKLHKFRLEGAVPFDSRNLTFLEGKVTIRLLGGRTTIPLVISDYQKNLLQFAKGESDLFIRKGKAYLSVSLTVPEAELRESDQFLGIDLGINNLAVDSHGNFYSGKKIDKIRERISRLRSGLQSAGTKSAKRHLKKLGKRESLFRRDVNHCISKKLVKQAKDTGFSIALEKLKKIQKKVKRALRARHSGWAFYQLRQFIEYKAKRAGIPVVLVNPKNTSRMCSLCQYVDKKNRKSQSDFHCVQCGHNENADLNAARNISYKARDDVNHPIVSTQEYACAYSCVSGTSLQPSAGGS